MQQFNRYVLWEVIKLFLVALVAFTTLIMLAGAGQELVNQGLGLRAALDLLPYVLPIALQYALPATLLFAVCSVFGRISADNEFLALMSAGVPPIRFVAPTLVASFLISLCSFWINDLGVSWGIPGMNRVVMHSIEQVLYGWLSTQGSYSSESGFSIHVHGIGPDGRELVNPTITTSTKNGAEPLSISARAAWLIMDPIKEVLRIELVDSEIEGKGVLAALPGKEQLEIALSSATKKGTASSHPSKVPIGMIHSEIRKDTDRAKKTEEVLAARTAMALAVGQHDWLDSKESLQAIGTIHDAKYRVHRLSIEPWRRWASGFWCFFFVWVGVPFAIWMRSADHWTSFGTCFMPILLIYFPVYAVGLKHAKDGGWPAFSVWLGNALLLAIGAFWLRRVNRG